jgi:molybdate-binding protein/DNA-binding transcriptional regulator YhcF (GntR family)
MDDLHLYQQIIESIRREILSGSLKPGDRLPSVRQMTLKWGCTNATVLRSYQELARQGLVISQVGRGTKVVDKLPSQDQIPLRRAMLLNRIEANLLEIITAGYSPDEVEQATRMALDRWRSYNTVANDGPSDIVRFAGSHDPAITLIAAQSQEILPGFVLQLAFTGSLGGLIALAEKEADIAGSHLWDEESNTYNIPFIRRFFPGQKMAVLTLAYRRIGLILPTGNPFEIQSLQDLTKPGIKFINRQPGSGTRVWLDAQLKCLGVDSKNINGYQDERMTHSEVASAIIKGQANVGLGVQTAALAFGLDFIHLNTERYELVMPAFIWERQAIQGLYHWLMTSTAKQSINHLGGYDVKETGRFEWIE